MREPAQNNNNLELGKSALGRRRRPGTEADQAVLSALATALRDADDTTGSKPKPPRRAPATDKSHPQVWRAGLMAAALALIAGGLGWVGGLLAVNSQQDALAVAAARPAWVDPLEPDAAAQAIEQEARLASVTIDLRETQESVLRVWNEARSAVAKIEVLASSMEGIKSDLNGTRSEIARVEDMLRDNDAASATEVAQAEPERLGYPEFFEEQAPIAQLAEAEPEPLPQAETPAQVAEAAATAQPAITGALPDAAMPDDKAVDKTILAARPKAKRQKRVNGWSVHSVRDDLALVDGHGVHYEVRVGELLPDAGVVRAIKKRGEQWIVLTNRGYIPELP